MKNIEKWMDNLFENTIPDAVVAIAFNLYEDGENQWSVSDVIILPDTKGDESV